jgi:menaquinone-dependent protoporphyrinogen oxidase
MKVLVAYASRHGTTRGVAERIASTLGGAGLDAVVLPVRKAGGLEAYDAFVIGSATYMFRWLGEASGFVRRNRATLASRPTWLFSCGPLGAEPLDEQGRDKRETASPHEIPDLVAAVGARGHHVFFGAWDPGWRPIGLTERLVRIMPAARDAFPNGDFRDWPEIEAWAARVAAELGAATTGAGSS